MRTLVFFALGLAFGMIAVRFIDWRIVCGASAVAMVWSGVAYVRAKRQLDEKLFR